MGRITTQQAGLEYDLIQSNKGLRVEHQGNEIFRHWPGDVPSQTGVHVVDDVDLDRQMRSASAGETFILPPGQYSAVYDPDMAFQFVPLSGHKITAISLV